MTRLIRSSATAWALGYVLVGLAALAAFAVPLWWAWKVTILAGREELLRAVHRGAVAHQLGQRQPRQRQQSRNIVLRFGDV